MATAATLPDALSDAARTFAAGPHRHVIGGERPEAADGRTFETLDPATGRTIANVPYGGAEDVDRAVRAAREAFEDGRWSGIAAAHRTRAMLALADAVEAHADELAELESLDNGKPLRLAKRVDVPLTAEHLRYFAGWPTKIAGETLPVAQPNMHCYTRREPVGVCAQIIPWNFPLLMSAWKVAPALAVADEAAPQVGVDRVDRQEQVERRARPFLERNLVHRDICVVEARRDFGVNVDHVDALLDARRQVDWLDRLIARGERRGRQSDGESERGGGHQQSKRLQAVFHVGRFSMEF